jgi:hypothetical protein
VLNFFSDMPHLLFKHYNDGIQQVPMLINGTLGHNGFVSATYPLSNIFDKHAGTYKLERLLGKDEVFFDKFRPRRKKRFVRRGFGVRTPLQRVSNESIELLYLDMWSSGGVRLTSIFESDFFNYDHHGSYHKAISTKPVWEWQSLVDNPYLQRELTTLLGLEGPLAGPVDIGNKDVISSINNSGKNVVEIDPNFSKIMVAATRSESSHLKRAKEYVDGLASSIKEEFDVTFGTG